VDDPRRATFWGAYAPPSWFDEAMRVDAIDGDGVMPVHDPVLRDRPEHVT